MRFLFVCGLICVFIIAVARCDEIETDFENDVMEDVLAAREKLPEKRGLPERKAGSDQCGYGFWCKKK